MQLRAILVGDTLDAAIGKGIIANLRNLESFLRALELDGKIGVSKVEIKGNNFNCKSINEAVAQLAVDPTDAVLFYYSGHGFRRGTTQSQFPEFDCMRGSDPDQAGLKTIADDLARTKKPRLLLAIADTCNKPTEAYFPAPPKAFAPVQRQAAFRRLIADYGGTLIMSSSVPGEYSYYTIQGGALGGLFTNQLLQTIDQKIKIDGANVRWEDIVTEAKKIISIPPQSATDQPLYQHPQSATFNLVGP